MALKRRMRLQALKATKVPAHGKAAAKAPAKAPAKASVRGAASSASLISKTQTALRRDIIRGVLAAGERLKIEALTDRYGVGLSPIREALSLLSTTGLVIREDRRGFRVAPVSTADYRDAQLLIDRLWAFALELALQNGDQAWEQRLVLALYRTLKFDWTRAEKDHSRYEEWDDAFRSFHRELVAGSGSPTLVATLDALIDRVERYRWLVPEAQADTALDDRNHRALVDAIVARDLAALRAAMQAYPQGGKSQHQAILARLETLKARAK
jgi:GntR family carbon starvation induced transcriptional regulator